MYLFLLVYSCKEIFPSEEPATKISPNSWFANETQFTEFLCSIYSYIFSHLWLFSFQIIIFLSNPHDANKFPNLGCDHETPQILLSCLLYYIFYNLFLFLRLKICDFFCWFVINCIKNRNLSIAIYHCESSSAKVELNIMLYYWINFNIFFFSFIFYLFIDFYTIIPEDSVSRDKVVWAIFLMK
jgi:hypothetical protein